MNIPVTGVSSCVPSLPVTIVDAFIYWNVEGQFAQLTPQNLSRMTVSTPTATITVQGTLINPSCQPNAGMCWGGSSMNFRADITPLIDPNNINVQYTFSNYPTAAGANPGDVNGVSMFIVYRDPGASYNGTLVIDDGCMIYPTFQPSDATHTMQNLTVCENAQNARGFASQCDLQFCTGNYSFRFNGNAPSVQQGRFYNHWDVAVTGINAAQTTLPIAFTNSPGDCWDWIFGGVYYQTPNCPNNCTVSSQIGDVIPPLTQICNDQLPPVLTLINSGPSPTVVRWETTPGPNCNAVAANTALNWTPITNTTTTHNPGPLAPGVYCFRAVLLDGCSAAPSTPAEIEILQAPSVTATSIPLTPPPVCPGQEVELRATGASTYVWEPGTLPGQNVLVYPTVTTTYTVRGTTANGCTNTATITVEVFNNPPTINLSPANPVRCTSDPPTTLTASGAAVNFIWQPGNINASVVNVNPAATTTYTVIGFNADGCSNTATITLTVIPTPARPVYQAGNLTPCRAPAPTVYSVQNQPNVNFTWSVAPAGCPGQTITPTGSTPSNSEVRINWPCTGTYTITVDVEDVTGTCPGPSRDIIVTVGDIPPQPSVITGPTPLCQGAGGQYCIDPMPNVTNYLWNISPNVVFTPPSNSTCIDVASFPSAGSYTITVTPANACGLGTPRTFTVTVLPPAAQPTVDIVTSPLCPNTQGTFSVLNVANTTWQWTLPAGFTIVSANPSDRTIQILVGANVAPAVYQLSVRATTNGCVGPPRLIPFSVSPAAPAQPASVTGPTTVCVGNISTYTTPITANATTYTWTSTPALPAAAFTGQGTRTLQVNWSNVAPGSYQLCVVASNSCGASACQTLNVTVGTVPPQPEPISTPPFHCTGTVRSYSVGPVPTATSYVWTNSCTGWTGFSSTNTIDYTAGPPTACTFEVAAINGCGTGPSRTVTFTPQDVPAQPSAITGPTTVCRFSRQTYSVTNVPGVSYTWSGLPAQSTIVSGQGTFEITVDWASAPRGSYTITVIPSNICGTGFAQVLTVVVDDVPAQPGPISGSTLLCEGTTENYTVANDPNATGYTWRVVPSTGATLTSNRNDATVVWSAPGRYMLEVTPFNACGNGVPSALPVEVRQEIFPTPLPDRIICSPNTVVLGNPAGGTWSCVNCPPQTTITGAGPYGIIQRLLPGQPTTFRYFLADGVCGDKEVLVTITNDLPVSGTVIGDATVCGGVNSGLLTLTGQTANARVVRWESSTTNFVAGATPIVNTNPTYTFNNITQTTQFRAVLELQGACPVVHSQHATVTVVPNQTASVSPTFQVSCRPSALVTADVPLSGSGRWEFVSGPPGATIVTSNGRGIINGMNQLGDYTFRYRITNPPCTDVTATVVVRREEGVTPSDAGPDQSVCGATATLVGNNPTVGSGRWEFVAGPHNAHVTTAGTTGLVDDMDQPGVYVFRWVIENAACGEETENEVVVTRLPSPSPAFAGSDREVCTGSARVQGNLPTEGVGRWSVVSWPAGSNPQVMTTGTVGNVVNMTVPGQYVLRWTISNGTCPDEFAEIILTRVDVNASAAVVQSDITVCESQSATLQAVQPQAGSGVWSFVQGPGSVVPSIVTTGLVGQVTGMTAAGTYVFRWTVTTACGASVADVRVTRIEGLFPPAFAGNDKQVCDIPTTLLQGSPVPPGGRGEWVFVSGPYPASVATFGVYGSVANMNRPGQYVFEWRVSNGSCAPSISALTVTRYERPTQAQAGADRDVCGNKTTLVGNDPDPTFGTQNGVWSFVSGPSTPSLQQQGSTVTVDGMNVAGTYVFRWTISNGPCPVSSSDVKVRVSPGTVAGNLSGGGTVCAGQNSGTLVLTGYTGSIVRWETSTNDFATIDAIGNTGPVQGYTNLTQTRSYRVLVQAPGCPAQYSNVARVTVLPQPVAANAGSDRTVCGGTVVLEGNDPGSGVGTWTLESRPGSSNPTLVPSGRTLVVSNMNESGDYIFRWTIASGGCGESSSSVKVSVGAGSVGGNVSGGTTVCGGPGSTATLVLSGHRGRVVRWERSTNDFATFDAVNQTGTDLTLTNLTQRVSVRAVVQDGSCPPAVSTVAVIDVVSPVPPAEAGSDRIICTDRTVLTGSSAGSAQVSWTLLSQPSGGNPTLLANGSQLEVRDLTVAGVYEFEYTVSNGVCGTTSDRVRVTVSNGGNAGVTLGGTTVCSGSNSGVLTLSGFSGDVVRWERSTNFWQTTVTISNTGLEQSYQNLTQTTQYRAVVSVPGCGEITAVDATVLVVQPTVQANAGADQRVCADNAILLGNLAPSGQGVWEYVEGPSATSPAPTVISNNNAAFVTGLSEGRSCFRYRINNAPCAPSSDETCVTYVPSLSGGSVVGSATVCAGQNGGFLNVTGHSGRVLRWELSRDGFVNEVVPIQNMTVQQFYINLVQTTRYRAVIEDADCGQVYSAEGEITVRPATVQANAGGLREVCGATAQLTGNSPGAGVGSWTTASIPVGAPAPVLTSTSATDATASNLVPGEYRFRWTIVNAPCASSSSDAVVRVNAASVAGVMTSTPTSVCAGQNSGALVLTGSVGSIVRWESSTDATFQTNVTPISNVNASWTFLNLTTTTHYRAVVKNGQCSESMSAPVAVAVIGAGSGGTVGADQTVCVGSNSGSVSLTGHSGTILRWEFSTGAAWTPILNSSTVQTYLNLTQTTQFRAVILNATCGEIRSGAATVTVSTSSVGGVAGGAATVCAGMNQGALTLTGHQGSIVRWESSPAANFPAGNVTTLNNQSASQTYFNLSQTQCYRALVQSGNCTPTYSTAACVTVEPPSVGGALTMSPSAPSVCAGSNAGTLTLGGNQGAIVRWERSGNADFSGATTLANLTSQENFLNLTTTACYRVAVKNGSCPEVYSTPLCVMVDQPSAGGAANGAATVCSGQNGGSVSVSGHVGQVVRWESSADCFNPTATTVPNAAGNVLTYSNLSATTCFRAVVKNGSCGEAFSSPVQVTVAPASVAGVIGGAVGSCGSSASGTLVLTGQVGDVQRWESSTNNFAAFTTTVTNATSLPYSGLSTTTCYRAVVRSATCGEATTAPACVTVSPQTVAGVASGSATVCHGSNSGSVGVSGQVGDVVRWEVSTDCFASVVIPVNTTSTTLTYVDETQTLCYRAVIRSGVCQELTTNTVQVTVRPALTLQASPVVGCGGQSSVTLAASGGSGDNYVYSLNPQVSPPNSSGTFTGLTPGSYTATVVDGAGCTRSATFTIGTAPTSTQVTGFVQITQTSAIVQWASAGTGVVYTLRYRVRNAPVWTVVSGLTNTFAQLTGLQSGTDYDVEVQYVCPGGGPVSPFSPTRDFRTQVMGTGLCAGSNPPNVPVPVPGGVYVDQVTAQSARVNWNSVSDAAGYIVSWGEAALPPSSWPQTVVCNPTTSFVMAGLTPGRTYQVHVRTNCSNCTSASQSVDLRSDFSSRHQYTTLPSREFSVSSSATAGGVEVYPNPNRGEFTVRFTSSAAAEASAVLYDLTGRRLWSVRVPVGAGVQEVPVSLSGQASGVYQLELRWADRREVVKVVVE